MTTSVAMLLRAWRERALLSQEELAHLAGLGVRTVRRLESGDIQRPRADSLRRLADALELTDEERAKLVSTTFGQAPAAKGVPRQLPATVRHFVGRGHELKELSNLLDELAAPGPAIVITAIGGTAGIGKTALALHWAHTVTDRFPDGQLYTNLRGFDPGGKPLAAAEALRGFLDALGVAPQRIPAGLDDQAALYRSLLADRRMLIVLDNARDVDQVRPLLPGSQSCLALVTSRHRLTGLVAAEGALPITLDLLTSPEAHELLEKHLGRARVAGDPHAADALVSLCSRLPLALAIVAARAATQPTAALSGFAAELADADRRLDALDADDPASQVRAVFSWSYQALTPEAARLFRYLGLHPGPDICAPAAASLIARPLRHTRRLLAELTRACLLAESGRERYTFHDLLRSYAVEQTRAIDAGDDHAAAVHRLLDHYLHTGHSAARLLNPNRDPIALACPAPGVVAEHPATYEQAMAWFSAEHSVLVAAVTHSLHTGWNTHTWQLTWAMEDFLRRQGRWHDWVEVGRAAIKASALGQAHGTVQARAHANLADAYTTLRHFDDAQEHLEQALDLSIQAGDPIAQAHILASIGFLLGRQGRHGEAITHQERALALYRKAGHRNGQANALNAIAWQHGRLRHHEPAIDNGLQALALYQELDHRRGQADAWDNIGYAHSLVRRHTEAVACYESALHLFRDVGFRSAEADTLVNLGDTHLDSGDPQAARAAWELAVTIFDDLGHPDGDRLRTKLGALPHA